MKREETSSFFILIFLEFKKTNKRKGIFGNVWGVLTKYNFLKTLNEVYMQKGMHIQIFRGANKVTHLLLIILSKIHIEPNF